ncbi:photosystem reaction center subunit H [Archaeoglobales archaeon]|nr:MAG: photosystem reaction center subunit H [Archaeoglobales archaeon]
MISEISSLFGLNVYTDEGRYVGRVEDVVIDIETRQIRGLALHDYNKSLIESRAIGVILPYRIVKSVGDIVIVKDVFRRRKEREKYVDMEEEESEEVVEEVVEEEVVEVD